MQDLVPMIVMTGMFAMIFGIVYIRSRENMALIEKGLNPRLKDTSPRPFVNLKWGLLLIGSGLGLLFAMIIDRTLLKNNAQGPEPFISINNSHNTGSRKVTIKYDTLTAGKDSAIISRALAAASDTSGNDTDDDNDNDNVVIKRHRNGNAGIYFALIAIGGGLGLFFSYRIEKKEWLDKNRV